MSRAVSALILRSSRGIAQRYESRLELARLLLVDFDPEVQGIFAQPCRLAARVGERVRHHAPDFLLITRSGTVRVVNVRPADRLQDPKIAEALAWPGELFRPRRAVKRLEAELADGFKGRTVAMLGMTFNLEQTVRQRVGRMPPSTETVMPVR